MSEKVTFGELIESIANETDRSKKFTHDFIKDFVDVINTGLEEDGKVNIAGLGRFGLQPVDEREGYNPQTGEKMMIPAHNRIKFKPYKDLRELVNAPYAHLESEIIEEEEDQPGATAAEEEQEGEETFIPTGPFPAIGADENAEQNDTDSSMQQKQSSESDTKESDEDIFGISSPQRTSSNFAFDDRQEEEQHPDEADDTEGKQEELSDVEKDEDVVEFKQQQSAGDETPESDDKEVFDAEDSGERVEKQGEKEEKTEPEPMAFDPAVFSSEDIGDEVHTEPKEISSAGDSAEPPVRRTSGRNRKAEPAKSFLIIAAAVVVLLLVAGTGYWVFQNQGGDSSESPMASSPAVAEQQQSGDDQQTEQAQSQEQEESLSQQPSQPQQQDPPESQPAAAMVELEINRGQTLWGMADNQYNDPHLWPWIYDANKSSIDNPDLIVAGKTLRIPLPSGRQNTLTASDSLEVARGYVETYRWYKNEGSDNARLYLWVATNYHGGILDKTGVEIDEDDLAFANRL